jgi:hypothetical protein
VASDFQSARHQINQFGDEGLLDERGAAVHSVDQVTLLPPAAELDSAATTTPALPVVETAPDDDSVHDGDDAYATSVDTASLTAHRPVVLDIHVVNSDVPDALEDPDINKCFA